MKCSELLPHRSVDPRSEKTSLRESLNESWTAWRQLQATAMAISPSFPVSLSIVSLSINFNYQYYVTPWQIITEIHELQDDLLTYQSLSSSTLRSSQSHNMTSLTSLILMNCYAASADECKVCKGFQGWSVIMLVVYNKTYCEPT